MPENRAYYLPIKIKKYLKSKGVVIEMQYKKNTCLLILFESYIKENKFLLFYASNSIDLDIGVHNKGSYRYL